MIDFIPLILIQYPSPHSLICLTRASLTGCRAGAACRFQHPAPIHEATGHTSESAEPALQTSESSKQEPPTKSPATSMAAKVVARPIPKALMDDPRAFQINQIQRRFKPAVSEQPDATTLEFEMKPSDPDFPYEMEALECTLSVPKSYPASGKPSLAVRNKDIPRGFQVNIERGFDRIATPSSSAYLLGLLNRLDQQLESILSGRKAETLMIMSNRAPPSKSTNSGSSQVTEPVPQPASTPKPAHPNDEVAKAKPKRQADVRQLEARFGRLSHYHKSSDGLTYTLPLDSPKRSTWPTSLQPLRSFQMKVPEQYPLDPLEMRLFNDSPEAKALESAFKERSRLDYKATITAQVNYLSSHVKEMAVLSKPHENAEAKPQNRQSPARTALPPAAREVSSTTASAATGQEYDDSHIKHIPRPPEWNVKAGSEEDSSDDSYESDSDAESDDEEKDADVHREQSSSTSAPAERGILISFPRLELHGIELLELTSVSLTVKCERCKEITDIDKLRSSPENSKMREVNCKKCATTLAARFRADMIHANSVRAGYLDLDACTVVDMLPSNFAPTCAECSTQYPAPGIVAVRGDNAIAVCRECHGKMSVKMLEVKFLLVSASASESLPTLRAVLRS